MTSCKSFPLGSRSYKMACFLPPLVCEVIDGYIYIFGGRNCLSIFSAETFKGNLSYSSTAGSNRCTWVCLPPLSIDCGL